MDDRDEASPSKMEYLWLGITIGMVLLAAFGHMAILMIALD